MILANFLANGLGFLCLVCLFAVRAAGLPTVKGDVRSTMVRGGLCSDLPVGRKQREEREREKKY